MGNRKNIHKKRSSSIANITGIGNIRGFKKKRSSVFDDVDYESATELSEWDNAYSGNPSVLNETDFNTEWNKAAEANRKEQKKINKERSVFDDDGDIDNLEEPDKWDKSYSGNPSVLNETNFNTEWNKAAEANRKKNEGSYKKVSVFDDNAEEDMESQQKDEFKTLPVVQGKFENEAVNKREEDDIEKCLALQIAEDFTKNESIAIVGGALCRYNGKFYVLLDDESLQRMIFTQYRKEVGPQNTLSIIRSSAALVRYCIKKTYDEFPVNSNLIVFENGTLEVDTGKFRKNSPKDLANSSLGIEYNPAHWKMSYTKHFLETIADGDPVLYELMLQVMGYIFSNDVRAKSFFYLQGVGDAGKSRFCDLIASFFPRTGANKVARIALQDLGGKFALGNLVNAKLNISEDLPDRPLSPTTVSRIKMLSDSNRLEAEAKYVQAFSFKPTCKLLFASNHSLRLKEYDAAFMNRVVYIPFMHAIPKHKQDKNILEKMQRELPGLFNHAFAAYKRLVADGYVWAGADIFKPEIAVVGSGISINKEQTLKQFIENCCIFGENYIISVSELQEEYYEFCREQKYTPVMGDRFSRELAVVLPETVTRVKIGNQRRGFKGIKLRSRE